MAEIEVVEVTNDEGITVVEVTIPGPQGSSGSGGGSGSTTFIGLTDVPATYSGQGSKVVRVNAGETALEFVTGATGDVTKVGTPVDNQVGVWTGDGTIEGDTNLTFDTSTDILSIGGTGDVRVNTAGTNSASVVLVGGTQTLTNKTLTSPTIGTSPTAAGATWTNLGTVTTADINGGTLDGVSIGASSPAAAVVTTLTSGTHLPATDGASDLGSTTLAWNNLHLDTGATINVENSNWVATHSSGIMTVSTGDLRVTTAGTNTASVVTVGGTQTLTAKTLTSPTIITSPTAAGATWTDLGTVTTADINGGTVDGAVIGGASAAAITGTTITANTSVLPDANDGAVLGASGTAWSDLFLASGGVINWNAGNATLTHSAGAITSNVDISVPDEVYGAGWNASVEVPTKNAVYDKIEALGVTANQNIDAIGISIDGGGSAITTGIKGDIFVPYDCTITDWVILADQTGSIAIDVWADTYGNYPPTVADTITGGSVLRIESAAKARASDFADSPAMDIAPISAGTTLRFNVDSVSTITRATLTLTVVKS